MIHYRSKPQPPRIIEIALTTDSSYLDRNNDIFIIKIGKSDNSPHFIFCI